MSAAMMHPCYCERRSTAVEANPRGHSVSCPCWGTDTPHRLDAADQTSARDRWVNRHAPIHCGNPNATSECAEPCPLCIENTLAYRLSLTGKTPRQAFEATAQRRTARRSAWTVGDEERVWRV